MQHFNVGAALLIGSEELSLNSFQLQKSSFRSQLNICLIGGPSRNTLSWRESLVTKYNKK